MYALKDKNGNIVGLSQVPQEGWGEVPDDSVLYESPSAAVQKQIEELEALQTPRLMREFVLGVQYAIDEVNRIDMEIAALRLQL